MNSNQSKIIQPTPEETNRILQADRREKRSSWSVPDLIQQAKEHPPKRIIEGLLNVGDILLVHATEESFKSVLNLQAAESIATGRPLLRLWRVRGTRPVGIIETEMHPAMLGERLGMMFPNRNAPENIRFLPEELLREWRRKNMDGKFSIVDKWIADEGIEVLSIDTVNDFFRGNANPSAETVAGEFFDRLRNLRVQARVIVRHDHKHREEDSGAHSNERIRGSAEFKEDPEAILFLRRIDKRTNEVEVEVGKLRYGRKPEPFTAWFDASCFRLTPLPPVIAVLEAGPRSRQELVAECESRFGLAQRTTDEMVRENLAFLREGQNGHERILEIDPKSAVDSPWAEFFTHPRT